jgi:hypothetical protein
MRFHRLNRLPRRASPVVRPFAFETRHDEVYLNPGAAAVLFVSRYRATLGRARDYMHYETFAPLDGPPPVAKTLGPEGTAAFLAKGAGLISQLDQSSLRRVADLSF